MILKEFKKLDSMNQELKINIARNKNITEKLKPKIGEILFSQLLPYVGNMNEFGIAKKYIMKIIDDIYNRYNYMSKANLDAIYDLICSSKEEIDAVKKEIKDDPELADSCLDEIIINPKKADPDYDENDD